MQQIDGDESVIYNIHSGSGINRKPYSTDEYQNLEQSIKDDEKAQAQLDKERENL